jgi:hypothetical protein
MKVLNCLLLGDICEFLLEGEPVFVIRAQDKAAPGALTGYIAESVRLGGANITRATDAQKRIIEWQRLHPKKVKLAD